MPVFPLSQIPDTEGRFPLSADQERHLTRVLRIKPGETFEVSLPDGRRGSARLMAEGKRFHGLWLEEVQGSAAQSLPVWLGIGLLKMSRLEWLVEKATELGVERLCLLQLSQGRISKSESISSNKIERLNKISQETLKQCERNAFMRIDPPQSLESFCEQVPSEVASGGRILLRERSSAPLLSEFLKPSSPRYVFLVGPEGGFSEKEVQLAEKAGFVAASLGPTVLRSETAALAALSYFHLQHAGGIDG